MEDDLFVVAKGACAAFVAVVCICRAVKMDNRVRRFAQWTYVLLGISSVGLELSPIMPSFMLKACVVGFMGAVCCMLIDGEKRWHGGIPDELLREEERWPVKERRKGERRSP